MKQKKGNKTITFQWDPSLEEDMGLDLENLLADTSELSESELAPLLLKQEGVRLISSAEHLASLLEILAGSTVPNFEMEYQPLPMEKLPFDINKLADKFAHITFTGRFQLFASKSGTMVKPDARILLHLTQVRALILYGDGGTIGSGKHKTNINELFPATSR